MVGIISLFVEFNSYMEALRALITEYEGCEPDNSWERGEFLVEISSPRSAHTLPGHPLIQCEDYKTERMVLGGWGVGQPQPFVYTSPVETQQFLTKMERWNFYNHGVILTLIHWLGPPFFCMVIPTHTSNLE